MAKYSRRLPNRISNDKFTKVNQISGSRRGCKSRTEIENCSDPTSKTHDLIFCQPTGAYYRLGARVLKIMRKAGLEGEGDRDQPGAWNSKDVSKRLQETSR